MSKEKFGILPRPGMEPMPEMMVWGEDEITSRLDQETATYEFDQRRREIRRVLIWAMIPYIGLVGLGLLCLVSEMRVFE